MVCLNYQTFDVAQQLNRALFRLNGGCGYVPQSWMRADETTREPSELQLRIISAQHLPKPADGDRFIAAPGNSLGRWGSWTMGQI